MTEKAFLLLESIPAGSRSLLLCAAITLVAMMSFYVHLLNGQVARGSAAVMSQANRQLPQHKTQPSDASNLGTVLLTQASVR